ncbi:hypothetical protein SDRG_16991 [Saprolegnia diclina VS20]|uniref:Uncharacterized protein n=1 Tax=Saprolegnia diclina (strain VS20) TaxID=1156394 RepID=T0PSA5_SAPDV|nr:hypothetical protein SDRG_16991 [Saprolegnia diclina VS20]EQC25121.1 hypothetical protein SDRG_16991 [Saprolegnia diclina VS20]|eukprot:XP_008621446.1 hypothetical protein SDRG_16991 [Saprolegnia diclina VS20]
MSTTATLDETASDRGDSGLVTTVHTTNAHKMHPFSVDYIKAKLEKAVKRVGNAFQERVFSTVSNIVTAKRNASDPARVWKLIVHHNL